MSTTRILQATIIRNKEVARRVHHIDLAMTPPTYKPGQFVMVTIKEKDVSYKKPYSIASAPWEQQVSLCVKNVEKGKVSNIMAQLKTGDTIQVQAPFGTFTIQEEVDQLFIATGTGISPIRSIIRTLFKKHYTGEGENTTNTITLLCGASTKKDIIYDDEFTELARKCENFTYHVTLTKEQTEGTLQGRVQEHLDNLLQKNNHVSICGVRTMVMHVKEELLRRGITPDHIHTEGFI